MVTTEEKPRIEMSSFKMEFREMSLRYFSGILGGQRLHERSELSCGATCQLFGLPVQKRSTSDVYTSKVAGNEPRELI